MQAFDADPGTRHAAARDRTAVARRQRRSPFGGVGGMSNGDAFEADLGLGAIDAAGRLEMTDVDVVLLGDQPIPCGHGRPVGQQGSVADHDRPATIVADDDFEFTKRWAAEEEGDAVEVSSVVERR